MFALVEFFDESQRICPIKHVKILDGNECVVKYRGCSYSAYILAKGGTHEELIKYKAGLGEASKNTANIDETVAKGSIEINRSAENESILSSNISFMGNATKEYLLDNVTLMIPVSSTPSNNQVESEFLGISGDSIYRENCQAREEGNSCDSGTGLGNSMLFENICYEGNNEIANKTIHGTLEKDPENAFLDVADTTSNSTCKDPDYEPSFSESDEENNYLDVMEDQHVFETHLIEPVSSNSFDVTTSANQTVACDPAALKIEKSCGAKGENKANFCFYCHKKQLKIARHLELKHKNEEDVKKFINLPKNCKERKEIIAIIRKKGNFLFNTNVNYNDGTMIVTRRPAVYSQNVAENYLPCGNCKGFYSGCSLRHHFAKCSGRSSKKHRIVKVMGKRILGRVHQRASEVVRRKLIPVMKEDDILSLIRYDIAIILYGNNMCERYKMSDHHHDMIRARMRLLGRFLKAVKIINEEITDLASVYDPKYCDNTITAINIEAGINETGTIYKTPSVASTLGTLLKKVGEILIIESIKNHDHEKKKSVKDFLKILSMQVNIKVTKSVIETQVKQKRQKKVQLPSLSDIKKLHSYLSEKRITAFKKLQQSFSIDTWTELAETTLSSLQLFNRRRPGEIQRILIEDFRNYERIDVNVDKELFSTLSKESQKMAMRYVRFTIRGKLNRQVPVLLNNELVQCIEVILKYRGSAKVSASNPYVFGIHSVDKSKHLYLKACDLMRTFSFECGAENPDRLRGTTLRKHIATNVINLNLSEQEISDLADFMGHAQDIHKNIYRQPIVNREIIRMSKLLEMAQGTGNDNSDDSDSSYEESESLALEPVEDNQTMSRQRSLISITNITPATSGNRSLSSGKKRNTPPYGRVQRRLWRHDEKKVVLAAFPNYEKKLPSLLAIQKLIQSNPCLQYRTAPQIKTWIHNQTRKK